MKIASYVIVTILVFSSWHLFLFRKRKFFSFPDRVVGAFLLGLSQIIATELLLGALVRKLFPGPLFTLNIILSLGVITGTLISLSRGNSNTAFGGIVLAARELRGVSTALLKVLRDDSISACVFSLMVISVCWMIFLGYLFPSYTWDALWYHLPMVGYMLQDGAIREIPNNSFINQWINMFPKNIELFFLWNVIFLESDVITDLSQLIFTIAGVISVYSICRKLQVERNRALFASMLFFFTPIMVLQSTTNYVDVAIAALFLASVNFIFSHGIGLRADGNESEAGGRTAYALCMAGLAAGILLGAKSSGPLIVVILSLAVLAQDLGARAASLKRAALNKRSVFGKSLTVYGVYFLLPVTALGGYWYIKNFVLHGNPVYPMQISFAGTTLFKGLYKGIVEPPPEIITKLSYITRPLYVWLENIKYYLYDSRLGGLGPLWIILFVPAIFFSVTYSLLRKKYDFLVLSAVFIATFLMYPRNWTPRYVIFIVGFGAVSFGFFLSAFGDRKKVIATIALLLTVYTFLVTNSLCITPLQIKKFLQLPPGDRTLAMQKPFNIDMHVRQDYGYWIWISRNIKKGDTLAYTFEPLFFSPLWNSSFSNRIVYINGKSYNEWIKSLKEHDATYVLIRTNSREDKWIRFSYSMSWLGSRERFDVVYADKNYTIAKLRRAEKR